MPVDPCAPAPPTSPTPSDDWSYTLDLPHHAQSVRVARGLVRLVLALHGHAELTERAELLTSELVTNAYLHAEGPASVTLDWSGKRLRVTVSDTNPLLPPLDSARDLPDDSEHGRGLLLVQLCSDDWGGFVAGGEPTGERGKSLWFEIG